MNNKVEENGRERGNKFWQVWQVIVGLPGARLTAGQGQGGAWTVPEADSLGRLPLGRLGLAEAVMVSAVGVGWGCSGGGVGGASPVALSPRPRLALSLCGPPPASLTCRGAALWLPLWPAPGPAQHRPAEKGGGGHTTKTKNKQKQREGKPPR